MTNRFPIIVNATTRRLEELEVGDNINLSQSGIYDGVSIGTLNQVLTSTGTGIVWKNLEQLGFVITETDPVFSASPAGTITNVNKSNWNTAYSWGNHATAGYLKSYTETDPVFSASPAGSITEQNKTNWSTAYGWGDHADVGYLTSYTETDPVFTNSIAGGISLQDVTQWDSAYSWGDHSQAGYLTNLSSESLDDLNNVILSGPTNGQILQYNGTNWVNSTVSYLSSYTETDTLETVTARGSSTSTTCTFQDLIVSGNLSVTGTTTQNNVTTLNVSDNEIIINSGQTSGALNAFIKNDRGSDPDTSIMWNEVSNRWQFTNDGTSFYNFAIDTADLTNTAGYITSIGSIDSHSDVTISLPESGQVLSFNGSEWVNVDITVDSKAYVSDTAPPDPTEGVLWWKKDDQIMKVYESINGVLQWVNTSADTNVVFANVSYFPGSNVSKGSFAYSDATGAMYYSNGVSWTSQRLVTTNSSTSSDFDTLLANTQLVYSVSSVDHQSDVDKKIIRLSDSQGVTSDIILNAGTGLSVVRSNNEITFTNDISFTYSISAEAATGTNAKLRLGRSDGTNDDILFVGADGLSVERTDENTITFRAPSTTVTQYTDEMAQDAAAALLINGSHQNISFTYNDQTNTIDAVAAASGGGGSGTTYDLTGSNTTSNNAIITLTGSDTSTDSIEFAGGAGTNVSWDSPNKKITITSTAPVNADWNATSGLAQILNKPTIPPEYTLPIASNTVLGGIKIGANLTINPATGVLDANPGSYTLPIASSSVLGGIKIGSGLSIDGNGVVSATGGSTVPAIQDLSGTTSSIASNITEELNIIGYKAYSLFKITTDAEAWVRVYVDDVSRNADSSRSEGEDPTPGGGVIAEVRTTGSQSILITPGIMGFNNDSPRTDTIYLSVTNRSNTTRTITVTLTALQIGE